VLRCHLGEFHGINEEAGKRGGEEARSWEAGRLGSLEADKSSLRNDTLGVRKER
jgi:hypothetical protein